MYWIDCFNVPLIVGVIVSVLVKVKGDGTIERLTTDKRWYWAFDDEAPTDDNPMSLNITTIGSPSPRVEAGKSRNSYKVDATHSYEIPFSQSCVAAVNCKNGYTVAFWIQVPGDPSGNQIVLTSGGEVSQYGGFAVELDGDNRYITVKATDLWRDYQNISSPIANGTWTHIAFIVDPAMPGIQFWNNGTYVGYQNLTIGRGTPLTKYLDKLYLGKSNLGTYSTSDFWIDELHIWEMDASVGQILYLYGLSAESTEHQFKLDFDYIYENNLISGGFLARVVAGTVKQIRGRYSKGLEVTQDSALHIGTFQNCIQYKQTPGPPTEDHWCINGFNLDFWIKIESPLNYNNERYILGTVDLLNDFTKSGFMLMHQPQHGCALNFTVRTQEFYQHIRFKCDYNAWYKFGIGYHPAVGGYYRATTERRFSQRYGNKIENLFTMAKVFVTNLYSFTSPSILYLGHQTNGAHFSIDELFISGIIISTTDLVKLDPIHRYIWRYRNTGSREVSVVKGPYNRFSATLTWIHRGWSDSKVKSYLTRLSDASFYFNGVNAYGRYRKDQMSSASWRDVEYSRGFSLRFSAYQIGTPATVSKAYYMDSGGITEEDWGFCVYYDSGFLNVVVSTSRYEWRQLLPWGFHQWIYFSMSWYPDLGMEVFLNHWSQGLFTNKTKRANPQNRPSQSSEYWYYGRIESYQGTLDDVLQPMYIEHIVYHDRAFEEPYSFYKTGMISHTAHHDEYYHTCNEGPKTKLSRHIWNASNDFDNMHSGAWLNGTLLFQLYGEATQVWRNDFFRYAVRLNGSSQVVRSDTLVTQCVSTPDGCYARNEMISFWIKPLNFLTVPDAQKQTILWIGTANITVLEIFRYNGTNKLVISAKSEQCTINIPLEDNAWTWVTFYWAFRNYANTIGEMWVNLHTMNITESVVCTATTREPITDITGRIIFGGEPMMDIDGPYQAFTNMDLDDIFLMSTFHNVHPYYMSSSGKTWGKRNRNQNWFSPFHYLSGTNAVELYAAPTCVSYVDIGKFPSDLPKLRIKPYDNTPFYVQCRLLPDTEVTETEVFINLTAMNRSLAAEEGRQPLIDGNYSLNTDALAALKSISISCKQKLSMSCNGDTLFKTNVSSYWKDNGGVNRYYWGGADDDHIGKCDCGVRGFCTNSTSKCNCDGHAGWDKDEGWLKEKDRLPVKSLYIESTPGNIGNWTIGNLICQNFDPNGMHWALDSFTISEDLPGRIGTFHGNQNTAMLRAGVWEYSKAIQLDGTTNYLTFPASIEACFTDVRQCLKGFSTALWVRVPTTLTNIVFVSNLNTAGTSEMGFSIGLASGQLSCSVRDTTSKWSISTLVTSAVWIHVAITWKASTGLLLYINGYDVKALGVVGTLIANNASGVTPLTTLHVGNDPMTSLKANVSLDEFWFSPYYVYIPSMVMTRVDLHPRIYRTSFDYSTQPEDLLANPEIFFDSASSPVEIPGVVSGALRLYTSTTTIVPMYKIFHYECLGRLDLCEKGLTLAFWARLHPDMWTDTGNYHTLVYNMGAAASNPGFHIYFKGRSAYLEIRDMTAGRKRLSAFNLPIEKWFHIAFSWKTGSYPFIYINSVLTPTTNSMSSQIYSSPAPSTSIFFWGFSSVYSAANTLMDVDEMVFHASVQAVSVIRTEYDKGVKWYRFPFDNSSIYGDTRLQSSGDLITIFGRVASAVYLRGNSYLEGVIPFYHECLSNPTRCVRGFTISCWLFIRPTLSNGTIVSAYNAAGKHGIEVTYTTNSSGLMDIKITVVTSSQKHESVFQLPPRLWTHTAFKWAAVGGSITVWLNGTDRLVTTSTVASSMVFEGDVRLVFGTDGESNTHHTDMAIDEFYFREKLETASSIYVEFVQGRTTNDDLYWSLDGSNAGGLLNDSAIPTIAQDVTYALAIKNSGAVFDGATNYANLGSYPGTCVTHLEFCQQIHVKFLLQFNGERNGDQYIVSRSTADGTNSGFYIRYANLEPTLPFRRYIQAGVKHSSLFWNVVVHIEMGVWMAMELKWSLTGGLEVWIDGILAGSDITPAYEAGLSERTDTTPLVLGKSNAANTNYALMKLDEIHIWDGAIEPSNVSLAEDHYQVGCYQSIGSFTKTLTLPSSMDPLTCRTYCNHTFRYVGLSEGVRCVCFPDLTALIKLSDGLCSTVCPGTSYVCGSSTNMLYFSIYRSTAHLPFPEIIAIENCTTNVTGPYEQYVLDFDLVDKNTPFTLQILCRVGNLINYNFTMGDATVAVNSELNTLNHTYTALGVYSGLTTLRNEKGTIYVPHIITATFPLFPILNVSLETSPTEVNMASVIMLNVGSGNDLTCDIDYGDGITESYYKKDYQPVHALAHTYTVVGDYVIKIMCSNPITQGNDSVMISIEKQVAALALGFNKVTKWVFEADSNKTLSWTIVGSHLETYLFLDGVQVPVAFDNTFATLDIINFNSVGPYQGWIVVKNGISTSVNVTFEVRVERQITQAFIRAPAYAATGLNFIAHVLIPLGSYAEVKFRFTSPTWLSAHISGDFINGLTSFTGVYPTPGVWTMTCQVFNNLTTAPGVVNISQVIIENGVAALLIEVKNSTSLKYPIPVNGSQILGAVPATNVRVIVQATRGDSNSTVLCYDDIIESFNRIETDCNITESGWYNVSIRVMNNVSTEVVWSKVELGDKLSTVEYNIEKALISAGQVGQVNIRIMDGIGTRAYVNFGDGYTSPGELLVIGQFSPVRHVYTQYGDYQISLVVDNQISSLTAGCSLACLIVQENISGLVWSGPFAFEFGFPIVITWVKVTGSHLNYSLKFDGKGVTTSSKTANGGFCSVSAMPWLTLGFHTVYVETVNMVSGPTSAKSSLVIVRRIRNFVMRLGVTAIKTNEVTRLNYSMDDATKVTVNITSSIDRLLGTAYYEDAASLNQLLSFSFGVPGVHIINGVASNPLGSVDSGPLILIVQNPVVNGDVVITSVDLFTLPVQCVLRINPNDTVPTNISIVAEFGDGNQATNIDFVEMDNETFAISHIYPIDGYYNVSFRIWNDVSLWQYVRRITVGVPVSNISLSVNKVILTVNESLVINASVKEGSNMYLTYEYGDNTSELASVSAGELHQTVHRYTEPDVYQLLVVATNPFSEVERTLSNLIIVQELASGLNLSIDKDIFAVNEVVTLIWNIETGTNVSCVVFYAGVQVYQAQLCNHSGSVKVDGSMSPSATFNPAKLQAWNKVTNVIETNILVQVEKPMYGIDLVPQYDMWPLREPIEFTVAVDEGSNINVTLTFNNSSPEAFTTFPSGEYNHSWVSRRSFEIPGFIQVTAYAVNPLGMLTTSKVVWIQAPINNGRAVVNEPDNYRTAAQFIIILNENDTEPTDLSIKCDLGNNVTKTEIHFMHVMANTWVLNYQYQNDGNYDVLVEVKNDISRWNYTKTITVGEYLANVTISVSELIVSTAQFLTVNVAVLRGSNALMVYDFGESGDVIGSNITKGEVKELQYMYTNPGVYALEVKVWNVFNQLIKEHHSVIVAFDMVRGQKFSTRKPVYAIDEDVYVDWHVPMGTNISCSVEFKGTILYATDMCNNTGWWMFQRDKLPKEIGNYTASIKLWNKVTRYQWLYANIRIERTISGLAIVLTHPFRAQNQSSSFEVVLRGGSNFNLEVFYSDVYTRQSVWYAGDQTNVSQTTSRTYYVTGDVFITARATNILMTVESTAILAIQAVVEGLYLVEKNTTTFEIPVYITIQQKAGLLTPTHLIIAVDWGDGSQTIHDDFSLSATGNDTLEHYYGRDGYYLVQLLAFNNISRQNLTSVVKVGEEILNFQIEALKTVMQPTARFSVCFNLTHGSNVSVSTAFQADDTIYLDGKLKPYSKQCVFYSYTTQGTYTLNATAQNSFSTIEEQLVIIVEEPIAGLKLQLPRGLLANDTSHITVLWFYLGMDYCVLLDLGDGGEKYVYGVSDCETKHPDHVYRQAMPEENSFSITHTFKYVGTYAGNLTAYNRISREVVSKYLTVILCEKPIAKLNGRGSLPYFPVHFYQSENITLDANVINPCTIPWNISMNWTVEVWPDNKSKYFHSFEQPNAPVLPIPPRTFPYGVAKVTFYVKVGPFFGIEDTDFKYIRIIPTPIVVRIKGNKARAVQKGKGIVIDARSATYDPDDPEDKSSLGFSWKIRLEGQRNWSNLLPSDTHYVARKKRSLSDLSGGILHLIDSLPEGLIDILVTVTKGTKLGSFIQTVQLTSGVVLEVDITCSVNCHQKVTTGIQLTLYANCTSCLSQGITGPYTYDWKLYAVNGDSNTLIDLHGLTTAGTDSEVFGLTGNTLLPGREYSVRLTIKSGQATGFTEYSISTNLPPYGGKCSVSPDRGVATFNQYVISCSKWKDEAMRKSRDWNTDTMRQSELYYTFYSRPRGKDGPFTLLHYGPDPVTPECNLPMGYKSQEYMVDILINIEDSFGEVTSVTLGVQVGEFYLNYDELLDKINGDVTEFDFHFAAQDVRAVINTVSTFVEQLDRRNEVDGKCGRQGSAQTKTNAEDTMKRTKARSELINKLDAACVLLSGGMAIQQAAETLKSLTKSTFELTHGSIIQSAGLIDILANYLGDTKNLSPSEVLKTSDEILGVISNLLEATLPAKMVLKYQTDFEGPDEEKEIKRKAAKLAAEETLQKQRRLARNVVPKLVDIVDLIRNSVLKSKLPGEKSVSLGSSDQLKLILQRTKRRSLIGLGMNVDSVSVTLPEEDIFSGYIGASVDFQMMTSKKNLYSWDDTSVRAKTQLAGMKFVGENGQDLLVKNLKKEIEFTLPYTSITQPIPTKIIVDNVEKRNNDLVLHNISFSPPTTAIEFTIKPHREKQIYDLFIKLGSIASDSDYDLKMSVKQENGFSFVWTTPPVNGTYFVAVRQVTRRQHQKIEYTAYVNMFGCIYWDEGMQIWTDDGCEAKTANPTSVVCACNHLTFFSADFMVAPNTIDFNTVFNKFADIGDNLAVLLTVIGIIVLFWIGILVLRRLDQRDLEKWKVRPLLDNSDQDLYRYVMTVITSNKGGAGTRSKIYFIVVGEDGDSDVRLLDDGVRKKLTSGSINHYLVTTPQDIGCPTFLRIWHDGSGVGNKSSWHLKEVVLHDVQKKERFHFVCDAWLAADRGDGAVERLVPQTSPEELKQFGRLFDMASRKEMCDQHLWVSVFSRPTRSSFTRVQRWGCCVSLLFTSMIASAMWFGRLDEEEEKGQLIKLGPFVWSTKQFFIATMTSIIVFPVNLVIIQLFRKSKPSQDEQQVIRTNERPTTAAQRARRTASASRIALEYSLPMSPRYGTSSREIQLSIKRNDLEAEYLSALYEDDPDKSTQHSNVFKQRWWNKEHFLPHCCIYMAWFLVFLSVVASAFFVILYSVEWGKEMSEMWLCAMFISLAESVVVIQPLKVLAVAILLALIFKDPVMNEEIRLSGDEEKDKNQSDFHIMARANRSKNKMTSLDATKIDEMKERNRKQSIIEGNLMQIVVYIFYLVVLTIIAYGQRDPMAFFVTKHVQDYLIKPNQPTLHIGPKAFHNIRTLQDYENWANEVFLPTLMPTYLYNGDKIGDWRHVRFGSFEGNYYRIGLTRLRQLRVKKKLCHNYWKLDALFNEECNSEYSGTTEDTSHYQGGWDVPGNATVGKDPWIYHQAHELQTMPLWGKLAIYGGGGYVFYQYPLYGRAAKEQRAMLDLKWLDRYTRAVVAEFVVYNANANTFACVSILMEMSASGSITKWWDVNVLNLYSYSGNLALFRICCEFIFCTFLLFEIYKLIRSLLKNKKKHFKDLRSYVDVLLVLGSVVTVTLYIVRFVLVKRVMREFADNKDGDIEFSRLGFYNRIVTYATGVLVFLSTVRMLCLLTFNSRVEMICRILIISSSSLTHYALTFFIIMASFTCFAFKVFGPNIAAYASIVSSFESLLAAFVGARMFNAMDTEDSPLGRAFFLIFVLVMLFIMTNILISILTDAMATVKGELSEKINNDEYLAFVNERLRDLLGFDNILPWSTDRKPRSVTVGLQCDGPGDSGTGDSHTTNVLHVEPAGHAPYPDWSPMPGDRRNFCSTGLGEERHQLADIIKNYGYSKGIKMRKSKMSVL